MLSLDVAFKNLCFVNFITSMGRNLIKTLHFIVPTNNLFLTGVELDETSWCVFFACSDPCTIQH